MTKGEERRDFLLVVPAVCHVDALGEHDVGTVANNTLRVPGKGRLVTAGRPGDLLCGQGDRKLERGHRLQSQLLAGPAGRATDQLALLRPNLLERLGGVISVAATPPQLCWGGWEG